MAVAQFPVKVMEPTRGEVIPLLWEEVLQGVNPDDFHVRTFRERLKKVGDVSTVMSQTNDFLTILHYFT